MAMDAGSMRDIGAAVQSLATAARSLRLYPATSPIPRQAVEAAAASFEAALTAEPRVTLAVAREGLTAGGERISVPGAADLSALMTAHGIAEIAVTPGCDAAEVQSLLEVLLRDPEDVRAAGGPAASLALAGVARIAISEIVLVAAVEMAADDIDSFLRELAGDADKLAAWLATAAKGDPGALSEALAELARAAGPDGEEALVAALGTAFVTQDTGGRDALVGIALGGSEASGVLRRMMHAIAPRDLAASLADGLYADNMLSMSNALATLADPSALDTILAEIRPLLEGGGHTDRELSFLDHMLEVRAGAAPELPLAERVPDYHTVARLSMVASEEMERARDEMEASSRSVNERAVRTMLSLLDQQQDFVLWSRTVEALAHLVPRMLADGDLDLADRVLADLSTRESRTQHAWPEMGDRIRAALELATDARAMNALLGAVAREPSAAVVARSVLQTAGAQAQRRLVAEALTGPDGDRLDVAEELLGRRIVDFLVALAPDANWSRAGVIARRLSAETDQRAAEAIAALVRQPDERARQEVARALGTSSGARALAALAALARDASADVATAAIRSLGTLPAPGAAGVLDELFANLDADGKDFPRAREAIGALARTPDDGADEVLQRIATRRALIKRGHFGELLELAQRAIANRAERGGRS